MSMHGGGAGRGGGRGMASFRRNRDILEHRIKKGTLPRMLTFARAYRPMIIVFLVAVILDSVISSISPRPVSTPIGRAPARQSLMPLYWAGLCDAVNITPGASRNPEAK